MNAAALLLALLGAAQHIDEQAQLDWLPPYAVGQEQYQAACWYRCRLGEWQPVAPEHRRSKLSEAIPQADRCVRFWDYAMCASQPGREWSVRVYYCDVARGILGEEDWQREQWPVVPVWRLPEAP